MGRAIEMEKDINILKKEVEQLKTAFSGIADTVDSLKDSATTKKHIDLHTDTRNIKAEGTKPKKGRKAKLVEEVEA